MNIKDIVFVALFATITVFLGLFPPLNLSLLPVPITLQSMGPMLAGSILKGKKAFYSQLLFLLLVAIGLPVLAGGRGGLNAFFQPIGGFLLSWPIAAFIIGYLYHGKKNNNNILFSLLVLFFGGIVTVYFLGITWLILFAKISIRQAFVGCMVFIPGDILKIIITILVNFNLKKMQIL